MVLKYSDLEVFNMANNYEKLIRCTKNQLEVFIDSLVNKPASRYVDWSAWLASDDPDAPYIGTPAFYKDENGEEKHCMLLSEETIDGEKHRKYYEILPKGEVKEECVPAHLIRLETEEDYPEIDPIRLMVDSAMDEFTSEQDFSLLQNKKVPTEEAPIEETIVIESISDLSQPKEETVIDTVDTTSEPSIEEVIETPTDLPQEETVEEVVETPVQEENITFPSDPQEEVIPETTAQEEVVSVEEPVVEIEETPVVEDNIDFPNEPQEEKTDVSVDEEVVEIEETPVVEENITFLSDPQEEVTLEEDTTAPSVEEVVADTVVTEEVEETPESVVEEVVEELSKEDDFVNEVSEDTIPEVSLESTAPIIDLPEAVLDADNSDISDTDKTQEIPVVEESDTYDMLKEDSEEVLDEKDDDFEFTLGDNADDLDKELAKFENTLTELETIVQRHETDFTPENTTNMTILETEEETDVPIHDLLSDIKISSGFYDPEDPDDRELPTIAFTAMNRDDD